MARDSNPVSTTAVRGLSWHRSLSGARARRQRRACEIDLRGARPAPAACAALCVAMEMVGGGQRRWFVGGDRTAARIRRRAGDDGHNARRPANTTLAATQRHLCRSGMVTADCARSRLRPESVWRLAALKDQRKIPSFTFISHHSRAREALMMAGAGGAAAAGRRRHFFLAELLLAASAADAGARAIGADADVGFAWSGRRRWCRRRSSAASYRVIDNDRKFRSTDSGGALPRSLSAAELRLGKISGIWQR